MASSEKPLPSFKKPPVIEVVFGVQFESLQMLAPHIGEYWRAVRDEFPTFEEQPPLPPVIEPAEVLRGSGGSAIEIVDRLPMPRYWFKSEDEAQIIQLQRDRLLFNWKGTDREYPRYAYLKSRFSSIWDEFLVLASSQGLHVGSTRQCELTYVNHVSDPDAAKHIGDTIPDFSWRNNHEFLTEPESYSWRTSFRMVESPPSRLHVTVKNALRRADDQQIVILDLTARGAPDGPIFGWFDLAHEWIVRGFADITSAAAHERWERIA